MADQPVTKREMQDAWEALRTLIEDKYNTQEAMLKRMEERLDELRANADSVLSFLNEQTEHLNESMRHGQEKLDRVFNALSTQGEINQNMLELVVRIGKKIGLVDEAFRVPSQPPPKSEGND